MLRSTFSPAVTQHCELVGMGRVTDDGGGESRRLGNNPARGGRDCVSDSEVTGEVKRRGQLVERQ